MLWLARYFPDFLKGIQLKHCRQLSQLRNSIFTCPPKEEIGAVRDEMVDSYMIRTSGFGRDATTVLSLAGSTVSFAFLTGDWQKIVKNFALLFAPSFPQ